MLIEPKKFDTGIGKIACAERELFQLGYGKGFFVNFAILRLDSLLDPAKCMDSRAKVFAQVVWAARSAIPPYVILDLRVGHVVQLTDFFDGQEFMA